ncbi:renalase isoform X3 [Phoenix dactylifera]|uniref:Renalase isoform X3 n=1 Tax=Phoenix dactylifera TaxID=42345 RepID=A0A8B8JAU1_PHODC|nr:renalase isoform X3 [Phoenix dactylifera]
MANPSRVAVIGSGISGAVCASLLAGKGVSVTVFESGRGAGGRMSQRRETMEDGKELFFDHGAPYFTVNHHEVMSLVGSWEAQGLVAEWKEIFGSFDRNTGKFLDFEKEGLTKKYVGVPGMNSICKALCREPGVETKFGVTVGKINWLQDRSLWSLTGLDREDLDISSSPELAVMSQDIPVRSCFVLMLVFREPLLSIPVKGFSFKNSEVLSWAFCDSSKPGRPCLSPDSEHWVLHSTAEYAANVITRTGLRKPTNDTLTKVAEELFQEFQTTGLAISHPFFMKAHRWGSAFPAITIGGEKMCLSDDNRRLVLCGDFCAGSNVEGAVLSGIRAASKILGN